MRLDCPHCGSSLEYSAVAPRFCSACGTALGSDVQTIPPRRPSEATTQAGGQAPEDPEATRAYPVPRRPAVRHPDSVGRYRLLRVLGGGGMGTVFEAEEAVTARRVALKLIRPEFIDSPDAVERFRREGRLASTLFHPRCVFVLAADEEAGQPYIVMELMPGKNLSDLVEDRGPLPVIEAVTKILDVIEGLQEAHRLGVVHRDVKPSNCFLDEDDRVKVGDFGLAKSLVGREQLTRSGSFLGTVLFASPEQIRNEPVDHQTDVYSVCATLYYLLTGRGPFQAEDDDPAAALARAVSDPAPSMRQLRKDVPRTLDEVVARGLAKSRRGRWQDLEELRLALLPFLGGPAVVPEVGWRVTAFLLDLVLLVPFELVVQNGVEWLAPASGWGMRPLLLSPLITLACGVVYFGLPEWLAGCSPGKFLTRLRVRDVKTMDRPSLPRSLWRTTLFYLCLEATALVAGLVLVTVGPSLIGWVIEERDVGVALRVVASVAMLALLPFLYGGFGVGLIASTMRRRNGYRGVHELLSGTNVIRLPSEAPRFRASAKSGWPAKAALPAGVPARVGSYDVRAAVSRGGDEMLLQGEDVALHRPVWLWLRRGGPEVTAARRDLARDARPRWLAGGEQDGWRWDAFVGAAGCALADLVPKRRRLGWRDALCVLEQLAGELEEAEKDGSLPDRLSPEQVWVQPSGRAMLLEAPAREPTLTRTPMNLLRQAAAVALEGHPRPHGELDRPIRAPVPWHASELMARLMGASGAEEPFASVAQAREALAKGHEQPEEISRPGRGLQVGLTFAGMSPGLLCLFGLGPVLLLIAYIVCVLGAATGEFAREQAAECLMDEDAVADPEWVRDQRAEVGRIDGELEALARDREVVLASWSWFVVNGLKGYEERLRRMYSDRLTEYQKVEDDEGQGLDYFLAKRDDLTVGPSEMVREWLADPLLAGMLLCWPLLWAAWAFATRGGLAPRLAGITLVGEDGRPAARWRCAWRTLIVWLPMTLLLLGALYLDVWRVSSSREGWGEDEVRLAGWLAWGLWWGALALVGAYVFAAIVWPNRGPHDRLSGVYPVPR